MVQFGSYYDFRRDPNRAADQSFEQRYLHFFGFLPGEPGETANERLEHISTKILPEVRTRLAQASEVDS